MEKTTVVGVDLAKTVFEIAVSENPGQVSRRQRLPRSKFISFFTELPPAIVVMEACGSAHYWGRTFEALGHTVVLLPPHLVKPYITRNKTDRADAKGILEAYRNTRSTAYRSRPCLSRPWEPSTDSGRGGSRRVRPRSTPLGVCCGSSASTYPWESSMWCRRCGF